MNNLIKEAVDELAYQVCVELSCKDAFEAYNRMHELKTLGASEDTLKNFHFMAVLHTNKPEDKKRAARYEEAKSAILEECLAAA